MEGNTEFQKPPYKQLKPEDQSLQMAEEGWLRGIKDRFNRASHKQEAREPLIEEKEPKISIEIFFSRHSSPEEIEGLADRLRKADIYIPEWVGWSKSILNAYLNVSSGSTEPKQALDKVMKITESDDPFYDVHLSELNMLYGSGKPIGFIDIPENHSLSKEFRRIILSRLSVEHFDSTFDQLFILCKNFGKSFGELQKAREDYMLQQLKPKVLEIINANPNLKNNSDVNVLMSLGGVHTSVFHQLANKGEYDININKVMDTESFDFREEIISRAIFGKDVNDTLVARAVAEMLLLPIFEKSIFSLMEYKSQKLNMLSRKLFSTLSFDEIRNLVTTLSIRRGEIKKNFRNSVEVERETEKSLISLFNDKFREKGIHFSWFGSEQELGEFLAKPVSKVSLSSDNTS